MSCFCPSFPVPFGGVQFSRTPARQHPPGRSLNTCGGKAGGGKRATAPLLGPAALRSAAGSGSGSGRLHSPHPHTLSLLGRGPWTGTEPLPLEDFPQQPYFWGPRAARDPAHPG